MADATTAPLKKEKAEEKFAKEQTALAQQFDKDKKYMFELASENPEREMPVFDMVTKRPTPHKRFKPFQNIVLTSQIVWEGQRRNIRYYDGCTSIFVDQQPKEKADIELLIKQTKQRAFLDGKFGCHGDERMLLLYLNICSWNTDSEFKTRSAAGIFKSMNPDKKASLEASKLDQTELALQYAKEASTSKMLIHAAYIGVPTMDYESGNELTEKEIRTEYRKMALRNSASFIESYGNKSIETRYYINKALEKGLITNTFNPNKATWGSNNKEICDISGLKSHEAISEKIFEFSQLEAGEEFCIQLKALYN